jgi:hypothetical protein
LLHELRSPVLLHILPPFPYLPPPHHPRGDAGPIASCRRLYPVLCQPNPGEERDRYRLAQVASCAVARQSYAQSPATIEASGRCAQSSPTGLGNRLLGHTQRGPIARQSTAH